VPVILINRQLTTIDREGVGSFSDVQKKGESEGDASRAKANIESINFRGVGFNTTCGKRKMGCVRANPEANRAW